MGSFFVRCFLLLFSASVMHAQLSGDAHTYTLDECLKIAMEHSYEIRSAQANYQTQTAMLSQNFGAYLPSLSANMGYSRLLNSATTLNIGGQVIPIPASEQNSNNYTMSATASYLLFNGFSREANYEKAKREVDAAEWNLRRTRQSVSYTIRSQYLNVLKAMQITKIRQDNVDLGKKEIERARALYEAGRTAIGSVYSQESELGTREIDLITAQNAESQAKAQLLTTMAVAPDQRAEFLESSFNANLDDQASVEFRKEVGAYTTAVQNALKTRYDYQSSLRHLESAEASVRSAKGGYMPNINANGTWASSSNAGFGESGRYYVGINLSLPIFDNLSTSSAVQLANIQVLQRELDRASLEQKVRADVQSAYLNLEAAEKQMEVSKRAVRSATQNYDATKERFAVGAATLLEYQNANQQLVSARINRVSVVYTYLDAQAQVRNAVGSLAEK